MQSLIRTLSLRELKLVPRYRQSPTSGDLRLAAQSPGELVKDTDSVPPRPHHLKSALTGSRPWRPSLKSARPGVYSWPCGRPPLGRGRCSLRSVLQVHVKSEVLAVKLSQEINYAKSLYYEQQLMLRLSENQEQLELDS